MYLDSATHADCCACTGCSNHAANGTSTDPNVSAAGSDLVTITYSFDLTGTKFDSDRYDIEDFERAIKEALATWSAVANINFVEADGAGASNYTHLYIETETGPINNAPSSWGQKGGVIGYGGSRGFGGDLGFQRFAWMDEAETWSPFGGGGTNYYLVALHEIGHAIGLGHLDRDEFGAEAMNPSLGSQKGIYDGDIASILARYDPREWTDAAEDVFLKHVQVGQTVDAKGGNDKVTGTSKADTISGGDGNDRIEAGKGNDQIYDTLGNNTVIAGDDNDYVLGGSGNGNVQGNAGNDIIIGGKGDDRLNGGNGNDTIRGDGQNSFFYGNDTIIAGKGTDFLEGGGGADTFIFREGDGTNTIAQLDISGTNPNGTSPSGVDFESGIDLIDVSDFDYASKDDAYANVSDVNGNAQFTDGTTIIIFYGLDTTDLSANDFII